MSRPALMTLIACVVGLMFSVIPLFIAGTAVLLIPISADTGWSRGDISMIIAAGLVCVAIGSAIVGHLITLFGPRKVIIPSTLLFACSLAAFAFAPSFGWALFIGAVVGLFGAGASQFAYINVLPLWFDRRFGFALGVAMLGVGVGTMLVPAALETLVRSHGWRDIYLYLAGVVAFIALPNAIFLLRVPGRKVADSAVRTTLSHDLTIRQILRGRRFWQLALCFFIATTVMTGVGIHVTALMTDRGYSPADAARVFSLFGLAMMIARFAGGIILDHLDARLVGGVCMFGAAIGAVMLAMGASGPAALIAVFLIALAHGLDGDLLPYMIRRYFGLQSYSTIYGLLALAFGLGPAVGAVAMGKSFDHFGSYTPILWVIAGFTLISTLLLTLLGTPPALEPIPHELARNPLPARQSKERA